MKNRENSMRVRCEKYWKSIEMKVKEVFLSARTKMAVEVLTLVLILFVFSKTIFAGG